MTYEIRRVNHEGLCANYWGPGESYVWAVFQDDNPEPVAHFYDKSLAELAAGLVHA